MSAPTRRWPMSCAPMRSSRGCFIWRHRRTCLRRFATTLPLASWPAPIPEWCWKNHWDAILPAPDKSMPKSVKSLPKHRFIVSIITSEKKRSKTCWRYASAISCSNPCGGANGFQMSRSRLRKNLVSAIGWGITRTRALCATCCKTICCNCCASSPWSRRYR